MGVHTSISISASLDETGLYSYNTPYRTSITVPFCVCASSPSNW
jgi:hypothetical protein